MRSCNSASSDIGWPSLEPRVVSDAWLLRIPRSARVPQIDGNFNCSFSRHHDLVDPDPRMPGLTIIAVIYPYS